MSTLRRKFEHSFSKVVRFTVVASDFFTTLWGIIVEMLILPRVFEGRFSFYLRFLKPWDAAQPGGTSHA